MVCWTGADQRNILSRETNFSGTNAAREILFFLVQLTTSRIGNLTRLIHTLAIRMCDQTYSVVQSSNESIKKTKNKAKTTKRRGKRRKIQKGYVGCRDAQVTQNACMALSNYERSEFLMVADGKNSTQKNVRRRRPRRIYWPIISLKTTVRTVLPFYSGARDPSGER